MLRLAIVLFITFITFSPGATAQPLADRVRSDAIIYFGWTGGDSMGPGYAKSYLKAVIDASNVRQVIDDFLPRVMQRIAQETGEAEPVRQILADVLEPMWSHPTAFYLGGFEFKDKETPPMPRAALICRAGKDSAQMVARLKEIIGEAPPEVPVRVAQVGDVVVVSIGFERAEDAVAAGNGAAKSLAQDETYRAALANVHKESLAALYVDFTGLVKQIDSAVATYADPEVQAQWPRVRDISGISGLKRIIATEAFEGQEWGSRGFVDAPAPRKGLLSVLESKPVSQEALKAIPKTSTMAGVLRFDLARFVVVLRDAIAEFDVEAGRQVDEFLAAAREQIGLDIQKDLLAALGDEWAYYIDPATAGKGFVGLTFVNRLRDPAKAEASLDHLGQMLNGLAADFLSDKPVKLAIKETKINGITIRYLGTPLISPSWAVADGNLYIGLLPQTVSLAADHVRSKSATILENESFTSMRKQIGGGDRVTSIQFMDLPKTAPDAYQGWMMMFRLVGAGDLFGVDAPAVVGPPLKTLVANLKPTVTVTWSDDKGWYAHSRVPFPFATALATDPMGGSFNTWVTLMSMLPNMARSGGDFGGGLSLFAPEAQPEDGKRRERKDLK